MDRSKRVRLVGTVYLVRDARQGQGSLLDVQRLENAVWRLWPREQRRDKEKSKDWGARGGGIGVKGDFGRLDRGSDPFSV